MRPLLLIVGLALPLGPAFAEDSPETAPAVARPVVSVIVGPDSEATARYAGIVAARVETSLGFPLAGTIAERPVFAGDLVEKGAVLARLDPEDFEAALRSAESGVTVAQAQLRSATDARDRAQVLAQRGVASATQLDDATRALVAAQAQAEQAEASRVRAQDQLALATLTAPQDGVVTSVTAESGAAVSAGQEVLTLAGTEEREIVIDLSEQAMAAYPLGATFDAHLATNPFVTATAVLDRIAPVADPTTRTRRLHLSLPEDAPDAFRLGALARVSAADLTESGIVVPSSAILTDAEGPSVWVVDRSDNTVHLRPITTGRANGTVTLVAGGLAAGEEVVTRGIHSLEDGQRVAGRTGE